MLDRQRGEHRIHHEPSGRLAVLQEPAENLGMSVARLHDPGIWLFEPGRDRLVRFGGCQRVNEHPRVRRDAKERPQRDPGESHQTRTGGRLSAARRAS